MFIGLGPNEPPRTGKEQWESDINFARQAISPPVDVAYGKWAEAHPYQEFALEQAGNYLFPEIAKGLPYIGPAFRAMERLYGHDWAGGQAQIAPEYRDPFKRRYSEELKDVKPDKQSIENWANMTRSPGGVWHQTEKQWVDMISDISQNNSSQAPYDVPVFRGGRQPPVPARGINYTPDPTFAASFTRGQAERGKFVMSHREWLRALKNVDATTLHIENPVAYPGAVDRMDYVYAINALNMDKGEIKQLAALVNRAYSGSYTPSQNYPPGAMRLETPFMQIEKFVNRVAADRGHDAIIRYRPQDGFMEMVHLPEEK